MPAWLDEEDLPVWYWRPNWGDKVTERLLWLTDVLASESGAEQRRALRISPRRAFEFTCHLHKKERGSFDVWMSSLKAQGHWLLPLWPNGTYLTANVGATDWNLPLDTDFREFKEEGYALILAKNGTYERVHISDVTSDSLGLASSTVNAWPKGTKIYPLRRARLDDMPSAPAKTATTAVATVSLTILGETDRGDDAFDLDTYDGYPVYNVRPNFVDDVQIAYQHLLAEYDNNTGIPYRLDTARQGFQTQQHRWLLTGRQAHSDFLDFLYALGGRNKAVWLPTFMRDVDVQGAFFTGGTKTALDIANIGYHDSIPVPPAYHDNYGSGVGDYPPLVAVLEARRDVQIEFKDGTVQRHKVIAYDDGHLSDPWPSGERIMLDGWIGAPSNDPPFQVSSIKRVSFMGLARLDTDTVEISHETDIDGASTVETVFRTINEAAGPPLLDAHQTPMQSNSNAGLGLIVEVKSPHIDARNILQFRAVISTNEGEQGSELTINGTAEQNNTLAIAVMEAFGDPAGYPTLSDGWEVLGEAVGFSNEGVGAFKKLPNYGDLAQITATWGGDRDSPSGILCLLNDCVIVQSAVAAMDVQITFDLPEVPTPGNWLIAISTHVRSCTVIAAGTGGESLAPWHVDYCRNDGPARVGGSVFYRRVPD